MVYADLLRFNPWWENKGAIDRDKDIQQFNQESIKYMPQFEPGAGLYVIRGPRQVGKTTLTKLKIKSLLEKNIEPRNIFYYSFELLRKPEDIHNIVLEYIETVSKEGKRYIFLDETTTIIEWARGLKLLIDRGDIKKEDTVLVTGSSSIDLKKGAERLPGRGIEGNEFYYLPCSFRSYLKLKGIELPASDVLDQKMFFKSAWENLPKLLTLNREFNNYLDRGGFLYSINHGKDELALEKYARWLEGDFIKWGKNPAVVKEILQGIIKKSCSQFSYHSITKETSVTSHNTIIDYLDMVDEELFLKVLNKATLPFEVLRKKEKKAFFLDPLLMTVGERWADQRLGDSCKIEQIVQSHLSRLSHAYFYNDGKNEIDCVIKRGKKILGVEVKWSSSIEKRDCIAVKKADTGYVVSKETLRMEGPVAVIPVSIFLAMLDIKDIIKRDILELR